MWARIVAEVTGVCTHVLCYPLKQHSLERACFMSGLGARIARRRARNKRRGITQRRKRNLRLRIIQRQGV